MIRLADQMVILAMIPDERVARSGKIRAKVKMVVA
jgi:hypothetical protein